MKQYALYPYRHIARITFEAESPIAIGTGNKSIETDAPVAIDINSLPFIPATSIAGVLRHAVGDNTDKFFGFQKADNGEGSKIIFTDAVMIGVDGKALDGILYLKLFTKALDFPLKWKWWQMRMLQNLLTISSQNFMPTRSVLAVVHAKDTAK